MRDNDIIIGAGRLHHLDSLRGVAALAVALHHSFACFFSDRTFVFAYSRYLFGLSPVVFFFLLSGFVLSRALDVEKEKRLSGILGYYCRRFFRLYPAALVSILFASLVAYYVTSFGQWPLLCSWFEWVDHFGERSAEISKHWGAILFFRETYPYNTPLWTIREEFACSFLLPLLIILLTACPWLTLATGGILAWMLWKKPYYLSSYMFPFYLGYMMHKASPHFENVGEKKTKYILFFALLLWASLSNCVFNPVPVSIVLGIILLVIIPCQWHFLRRLLESAPLRFLGRISYSFYLLHFPIMLLICGLLSVYLERVLLTLGRTASSLFVFLLSVSATLIAAEIMERLVESPFNRFGRVLSKKIPITRPTSSPSLI